MISQVIPLITTYVTHSIYNGLKYLFVETWSVLYGIYASCMDYLDETIMTQIKYKIDEMWLAV